MTASGEVFTWGYVYYRELLPRQVNGPWEGKIPHLATSGAHTAAITDSGWSSSCSMLIGVPMKVVVGWGLEVEGGPGEAGSLSVPSKLNALPVPVAAVVCGGFFTMALTPDGQLWSWGANSNFKLGRGSNSTDWMPQLVPSLKTLHVIQVACGGYHSLALTATGEKTGATSPAPAWRGPPHTACTAGGREGFIILSGAKHMYLIIDAVVCSWKLLTSSICFCRLKNSKAYVSFLSGELEIVGGNQHL